MKYHLVMGNQSYSSWSLRGWLLLQAYQLNFTHEVVPLFSAEFDAFQTANFPALTVPTLLVKDAEQQTVIWDSFAIAEFLHEQHPSAGFWPSDRHARAAARSLCAEMHSSFSALRTNLPLNLRRQNARFTPNAATQADIDRIETLWTWAVTRWGGSGPYLFGLSFSAVDAFFTPVASRFKSYRIKLNDTAQNYADYLLQHPASIEFYAAAQREDWVIDEMELAAE